MSILLEGIVRPPPDRVRLGFDQPSGHVSLVNGDDPDPEEEVGRALVPVERERPVVGASRQPRSQITIIKGGYGFVGDDEFVDVGEEFLVRVGGFVSGCTSNDIAQHPDSGGRRGKPVEPTHVCERIGRGRGGDGGRREVPEVEFQPRNWEMRDEIRELIGGIEYSQHVLDSPCE